MSETKKVITVADRSTKALVVATTGLAKIASDLSALSESTVKLADDIEFKQSQLDNLNVEFDNKFRESAAQLRLRVLEDEDGVLIDLLQSRGLAHVKVSVLNELESNLETALADNSQAVAEAEANGFRKGAAEFQQKLKDAEAAHRIQTAELTAKSNAKDDRIALLMEQLEEARGQIKAERETRLAIAEADSKRQGVVLNTGK
ncbi:hypothetical protein HYP97_gp06 [Klebsiella phage KpCHEMY26]|uniref:Uncharacterized protein n=1 Tax=Klebsiella phage KpCHEMY26 TaxID=2596966 RepID=A0A5B8R4A7_9CAUD|nr:hypothetical protein HYP97_gp06 [Klebsiella phage KpCHEMY26]QEA03323.1 hypothetical protein [Klebsiella phage KpCHEMY26]